MDYEPKKRITKNDKKNKKLIYNQKYLRIKSNILEKRRNESIFHVNTPKPGNGVRKSGTKL